MNGKCQTHDGYKDRDGYGYVTFNGKQCTAHRAVYQQKHGLLFPFMIVRHKCDDPS